MEKELMLHILNIGSLESESQVRAAYMQKLKDTNPEDDPEGFRKLREAYEEALSALRDADGEEKEQQEKSETDLWIDQVDVVYRNFRSRGNVEAWKALLNSPVCQSLDTSLDARDAMMNYLLSHFYLPKEIWQLLSEEFQIMDDYEELKERYPSDFLDYIRYYIENDYFIDFTRMRPRDSGVDASEANVDGYIRTYLDLRGCLDRGEHEKAGERLEELSAFGVWYPWETVERMRLAEARGSMKEAVELAESLVAGCPEGAVDEGYIIPKAANVKWNVGDKETAFAWWSRVPDVFDSRIGMMKYYLENPETAEKAKDIALDIWEQDGSSQRVDEYVQRANEMLLEKYEAQAAEPSPEKRDEIRMEMAWCHYQNKNLDKALEILDDITPSEDGYYNYHNLKGRVLAALGRNKDAVPELQIWLNMILETVDDGSEEAKKRLRRKGTAYYMLGFCLSRTEKYEEAVEILTKAEKEIDDRAERLASMNTLAEAYIAMKAYEKSIDQCDRIIAEDQGYFPAYVNRQEAYYELKNGQQVVDNYYRAIEIYPGYYKPYLRAAQVFFFCHQYEDARGVIKRARDNQVEFSDEMKLYEAKIIRNLANSMEEREEAFQIVEALQREVNREETDIEDFSEIAYERALLYWDSNSLSEALKCLNNAIRQNPSRLQYFMVRGEIQRGSGQFEDALASYQTAKEDYEGTAGYHYGRGCCFEKLDKEEKALEEFLIAVARDNKYRDVNEKIADIYMERYKRDCNPENLETALRYANQEVENWEGCYTLVHRGLMYMDAMKLTKAIADFEKALTFSPDDWAAYNNLGYCYKHKSEFDKSIAMYEKALEMLDKIKEKRVLPYSNMADSYELKRDYKNSIACYEKDLEWYPDRTVFYQEIGDLYFYLGEYKKAIEFYEKAGSKWRDKEYLLRIGDVYFVQGRLIKAKSMYKKAIQVAASNVDAYARHQDYAYRLVHQFFDYRGAISILDKANKKLPSGWAATQDVRADNERLQARAYALLREEKEAAKHAKRAKDLYLKNAYSEEAYLNYPACRPLHLSQIGECYLHMGEMDKAFEMFQQMGCGYRCRHCRQPECYEKYRNLGLYYLCLGDGRQKEALENYERALEICAHDLELQEMVKKLRKEIGR